MRSTSKCALWTRGVRILSLLAVLLALLLPGVGRPAAASPLKLPAGAFHTVGSQIVDQSGTPVRLACVYWQGMNVLDGVPHAFNSPYNGFQANMNAIAAAGFNCVRIDWNNRSLHFGAVAAFLAQMDQAVATAKLAGLKIIFVDHDNEGLSDLTSGHDCASQQHNGLWYDVGGASDGTDGCAHPGHTTQASYQADWAFIASRYAGDDTVIGYDLWNEPFTYGSSTWGDGTAHDIRQMYQQVGSAMLAYNPGKLIVAECPQNHGPILLFDRQTISYAPWGDCTGARYQPVVFTVNGRAITNQVVYSIHSYPSSISGIASIFGSSGAPGIVFAMNASFGFLIKGDIAPIWDGEGGSGYARTDDRAWGNMITQYLNGGLAAQGGPTFTGSRQGMSFSWMGWESRSGPDNDLLGILRADGSLAPDQAWTIQQVLFYSDFSAAQCHPSMNGLYLPKGAGSVVDSLCNRWAIAANGHVIKNGAAYPNAYSAIALAFNNGLMTFENVGLRWYELH